MTIFLTSCATNQGRFYEGSDSVKVRTSQGIAATGVGIGVSISSVDNRSLPQSDSGLIRFLQTNDLVYISPGKHKLRLLVTDIRDRLNNPYGSKRGSYSKSYIIIITLHAGPNQEYVISPLIDRSTDKVSFSVRNETTGEIICELKSCLEPPIGGHSRSLF